MKISIIYVYVIKADNISIYHHLIILYFESDILNSLCFKSSILLSLRRLTSCLKHYGSRIQTTIVNRCVLTTFTRFNAKYITNFTKSTLQIVKIKH